MMTKEDMVAKLVSDLNLTQALLEQGDLDPRSALFYIKDHVLGEMLGVEVDEIVGDKGHKRYVVKTGKEVR